MKRYLPLALLLPAVAVAGPLEMELGKSYDHLDNGYASWQSTYLDVSKKLEDHREIYGEVRSVKRFGETDSGAMVGYVTPLGNLDTVTLEGAVSPEHHVLSSSTESVQYAHRFANEWSGNIGFRHSHYDPTAVNIESAGVEKYFGSFRAAYTFYESQLDHGASSPSHSFALNYYFNDRDMIGVIAGYGLEAERINPTLIRVGHVHSLTLLGKKSINQNTSLTFNLGYGSQENAYDRWGASLGIRRQF